MLEDPNDFEVFQELAQQLDQICENYSNNNNNKNNEALLGGSTCSQGIWLFTHADVIFEVQMALCCWSWIAVESSIGELAYDCGCFEAVKGREKDRQSQEISAHLVAIAQGWLHYSPVGGDV